MASSAKAEILATQASLTMSNNQMERWVKMFDILANEEDKLVRTEWGPIIPQDDGNEKLCPLGKQ